MLPDSQSTNHEVVLLYIAADPFDLAEAGRFTVDGAATCHLQSLQVTIGERVEQSGLSGPRRSHDGQEFARMHNTPHCRKTAIQTLGNALAKQVFHVYEIIGELIVVYLSEMA